MRAGDTLGGVFGCLIQIGFLVLGFFQLIAMMAQIESLWHLNSWVSGAIGIGILMIFPVAAPFFSFFGAKDVWGWEWWQALLFAAPFLVLSGIFMVMGGIGSLFSNVGRRNP